MANKEQRVQAYPEKTSGDIARDWSLGFVIGSVVGGFSGMVFGVGAELANRVLNYPVPPGEGFRNTVILFWAAGVGLGMYATVTAGDD